MDAVGKSILKLARIQAFSVISYTQTKISNFFLLRNPNGNHASYYIRKVELYFATFAIFMFPCETLKSCTFAKFMVFFLVVRMVLRRFPNKKTNKVNLL